MTKASRLQSAIGSLVRIRRAKIEDRHTDAFVLAVSSELVLLQPIRDRLDLDGYHVVRARDITGIAESPKHELYEAALALARMKPVLPKGLDLRSVAHLLVSLSKRYGAIVVERELAAPDSCEVGLLHSMTKTTFTLDWLNPMAEFEEDRRSFRLSSVTRVQFDGAYENTLAEIARRRA